jgi:hypothetical protein
VFRGGRSVCKPPSPSKMSHLAGPNEEMYGRGTEFESAVETRKGSAT